MEQLCYSGDAVNVLVFFIFGFVINDVFISSLDKQDELNTTHFSNCLFGAARAPHGEAFRPLSGEGGADVSVSSTYFRCLIKKSETMSVVR